MAIVRKQKDGYNLVKSNSGKRIRIKGQNQTYSEATDLIDKPRDWIEVED